ncbi:MAG: protein kinase [Acidobacteriota bacterium]|nr:protein kinase [Acidobacteriota bacterium]
MIGKTIGHYEITGLLGKGGMGEVYLARDSSLGRDVALKVLPPEVATDPDRLERLQREAKALAALDHPNIVTVHSVEEADGAHFITMGLVEGRRLDELIPGAGLRLDKFFEIAIPLAEALSAAHGKGITHRDLKPQNIMVTAEDGRLIVLDFGLAMQRQTETNVLETTQQATEATTLEDIVAGTVPYMSPEQLEGRPLDHRTDVFSLGVILYEMACGQRPFRGESSASLVSSILRDPPPPLADHRTELPYHLGRVILRCLEKDPKRRYQAALDVRNELEGLEKEVESGARRPSSAEIGAARPTHPKRWWLVAAGALMLVAIVGVWWIKQVAKPAAEAQKHSDAAAARTEDLKMIAVLPFDSIGPPEEEYFAAGITGEITSRLAGIAGLGVISRKSAATYAETDKTVSVIAKELGVEYLLGGTVRWARSGDGPSRVRVAPELIQVPGDIELWSDIYDRMIDDIFEVQSEIAVRVIEELGLQLGAGDRELLTARPTENMAAYQAYLQAEEAWQNPQDWERLTRAGELYARATELDPSFVEAWARRAQVAAFRVLAFSWRQGEDPVLRLAEAEEHLARAEAIDPDASIVRLARGYVAYWGRREYEPALREFLALEKLQPNSSEVAEGIGYILRRQGKLREALDQMERAYRLDPRDLQNVSAIAETYGALRLFDEAIRWHDKAIEIAPDNESAYSAKARTMFKGSGDLVALRAFIDTAPVSDETRASMLFELAIRERDFERALAVALSREGWSPHAFVLQALGHDDEAVQEFEKELQEADRELERLPDEPRLHARRGYALQGLGRFDEAIAELNRAQEMIQSDQWDGPSVAEDLASLYAAAGKHDGAIALIEDLLQKPYPYPITIHDLRVGYEWDRLRDDPRFQALLDEYN